MPLPLHPVYSREAIAQYARENGEDLDALIKGAAPSCAKLLATLRPIAPDEIDALVNDDLREA